MSLISKTSAPALALAALLPRAAQACAVCFSGSDESRLAFILTTVLLTVLPLTMIGGAIYWVTRRVKRDLEPSESRYVANR